MKRTDLIKKELSRTLVQMVNTQPLKNVKIKALVDNCGINRGTFYYHFKDIYDLINWTFESEIIEPLKQGILAKPEAEWNNLTLQSLQTMYSNKNFYCQAIRLEGQNNLKSYMMQKNLESWQLLVEQYLEESNIEKNYDDSYFSFLIKYTSQAICNMTIEWTLDGMKVPVEMMAKMNDVATHGIYGVIAQQCNQI